MQSFYGGFAITRDYSDEGGGEEKIGLCVAAPLASDVVPNVQQRALPQKQPTGDSQSFFNGNNKAKGVASGHFQSISYEEFDDFGGDVISVDVPAPRPLVSRVPVSNGVSLPVASSRETQPNSPGLSGFPAQHQSQPCSRQLDFRSVSFADWLAHVDASGSLSRYLEAIEESYDTVAQILKTYSTSLPGEASVDPQFFEDIEVTSAEHKALFRAWFAEANGLNPASLSSTGGANVSAPERDVGASGPQVAQESPANPAASLRSREELRMLPFRTWLLQVDPGGSVLHYQETLEANYDTVAQVAKTYALPAKGGKVLDVQFFEDSGIVSEQHRLAFARWFIRECDLSMPGDMR